MSSLLLHFSVIFLSTRVLIFEFSLNCEFHSFCFCPHLLLIFKDQIIILSTLDLSFITDSLNFFFYFGTLFASEQSYKHAISQHFYSNSHLSLTFSVYLTFVNPIFFISLSIHLCFHHEENLGLGGLSLINYQ